MSIKKQILIIIAIAAIGLVGYQAWHSYSTPADASAQQSGPPRKPTPVETAPATLRQLDRILEAVGTTKALRSVEITPLSAGRVEKVNLTTGSPVKANAILLELDSVIQEADVVEAKAKLEEATRALQRSDALKDSSGMSEATLDSLRAQVKIAQANLGRAEKRLEDRVIRAPFSGLISLSSIEKGARVKEGEVVAVLDDLSKVMVEFAVPEDLFGTLATGETIVARAASFPDREFAGTISAIDTRVDNASRSFKVRGIIDNSDRAIPAGMFIHVSILLGGQEALVIPEEAVVVEGGQQFVFALQPGKEPDVFRIDRRSVTLGRRSSGVVQIKEGLAAGEEVVTQGLQKVRHGALVQKRKPGGGEKKTTEASSKNAS